jgi:branched-chain amino acid transport system substrate-binding protein
MPTTTRLKCSRNCKRMQGRRRGLGAASLVIVALMGAACAGSSKVSTAPTTTTAAGVAASSTTVNKSPLNIGISLSLTGDFADSGKAEQKGYQLWADTVNAKGGVLGRQVALKIVDDASSTNQVVTNYQNLISKDNMDLVFGPFSTLLTIPASQVAKRFNYSFIEPAGGGPAVFDQHLDNLFFVQPAPVVASGDVFADYVLSLPADQKPKTAAYPSLDDPFSSPIADHIRQRFEAAGIKTVYNKIYPPEATDLTPVVAQVAAAKPDAVIGGTQTADAYAMVKAMIQLKFNPKLLFLSNGANSPTAFPSNVGAKNTEGVFSAGDWFAGSPQPGSKEFIAAYIKKFGGDATGIDNSSAEAYSAGQLVEAVAAKTGKVDNATIISTLHQGKWTTVVGDLSWDASGAPSGRLFLVQWIGGQLVPVYPATLAQHDPVPVKPNWPAQ